MIYLALIKYTGEYKSLHFGKHVTQMYLWPDADALASKHVI